MIDFDEARVRETAAAATTEELLDRATVYRDGMEPRALSIITAELMSRGVDADDVAEHAAGRRAAALFRPDGLAVPCDFCDRPAVVRRFGWHRVWGTVPVFPRRFATCATHAPAGGSPGSGTPEGAAY